MNDFETRLSEALTSGAAEAPDIDGLAAGARRRSRTRRRTLMAVGSCVVVAALAVPIGVLAVTGDGPTEGNRVATDPPAPTPWRTVEHQGVLVDIPSSWVRLDTSTCVFDGTRYGPHDSDPCTFDHDGLVVADSAETEPYRPPGVVGKATMGVGWTGFVNAGDSIVSVQTGDREEARRILGTVREDGQAAPDLSAAWRTESYEGLSVDVPASWQRGGLSAWCLDETVDGWVETPETIVPMIACEPSTGYGIRFSSGERGDFIRERHGSPYAEGSWAGVAITGDEAGKPIGVIQVVAPTQALAEVIGGSLRAE